MKNIFRLTSRKEERFTAMTKTTAAKITVSLDGNRATGEKILGP